MLDRVDRVWAFRRTRSCSHRTIASSIPFDFSRCSSSSCHRRDKKRFPTSGVEFARIGFDAAPFRAATSVQCRSRDRPSVLTSRRTLGQRIAPLYSNRENRHLAVTSSRSHLLQRTTFGRARDAGSRGRELIAQPSFTTSRPRRCSFVSPRPSTPCGMKSSVLTTSATVRARSRAQEAAHLSMFSTLHASSCTHRCPKPRKLARSPFG